MRLNSRGVNTRELFQFFGLKFLGCRRFGRIFLLCLLCLPIPTKRPKLKQQTLAFQPESFQEKACSRLLWLQHIPPNVYQANQDPLKDPIRTCPEAIQWPVKQTDGIPPSRSRWEDKTKLATGRQPGTFSEISYGKSYTKVWILKGVQGPGRGGSPCTPPFKIQICVNP